MISESVCLDDLVSTGVMGLISAIDNFDPRQNAKLKTYAEFKIRGAILDSLRNMDWASRHRRKKAKDIEAAIQVSLDALDEECRDAVGRLSVFGLTCWDSALESLGMPRAESVMKVRRALRHSSSSLSGMSATGSTRVTRPVAMALRGIWPYSADSGVWTTVSPPAALMASRVIRNLSADVADELAERVAQQVGTVVPAAAPQPTRGPAHGSGRPPMHRIRMPPCLRALMRLLSGKTP